MYGIIRNRAAQAVEASKMVFAIMDAVEDLYCNGLGKTKMSAKFQFRDFTSHQMSLVPGLFLLFLITLAISKDTEWSYHKKLDHAASFLRELNVLPPCMKLNDIDEAHSKVVVI